MDANSSSTPNNRNKKIVAVVGLIVIVAAISAAVFAFSGNKPTASVTISTSPSPSASASPTASAASPAASPAVQSAEIAGYKDGTYSASGGYISPGGSQSIKVSVTLKNGVITDTTATPEASDSTSSRYQSQFISGYKSQVVGKSIDSVSLSRVSGSSLTSGGFNKALSQIKSQAKA